MALQFTKTFDTPKTDSKFSPKSLEASFGLDGNDSFYSLARSSTFKDGLYWNLPSVESGGDGDDSYTVQYSDCVVVADAGSGNDYLRIYRRLDDVEWAAKIDGRHLAVQFSIPYLSSTSQVLIIDAFRPDGSIEKTEFENSVILDTTWNNLPSLIASAGIPFENLTWDQAASKKYINLSVIGVSNNSSGAAELVDEIYKSGNPITKAGVHRFFNPSKGVHFYSNDLNEVNTVRSRLGNYQYEGKVYDPITGVGGTSLNRFFNPRAGYHFMTTSDSEAQSVRSHPEWGYQDEGKSYSVSKVLSADTTTPVYRFFRILDGVGQHFYTSSDAEKLNVIANPSWGYSFEGIAWYAN